MPRPCAVESHVCGYVYCYLAERELSTAQGRGIQLRIKDWCSDDREVPRDKPMAF